MWKYYACTVQVQSMFLSFLFSVECICKTLYFTLTGDAILGEEIVAGDDLYGGSDRLLSQVIPKTGIVVKLV